MEAVKLHGYTVVASEHVGCAIACCISANQASSHGPDAILQLVFIDIYAVHSAAAPAASSQH